MNERITLTDTPIDIMKKLSEGNPGALSVLMQLLKDDGKIDPQDIMGGIGVV